MYFIDLLHAALHGIVAASCMVFTKPQMKECPYDAAGAWSLYKEHACVCVHRWGLM